MKISENIKAMMICFLNNNIITSSWAMSEITISEKRIDFNVNGLNFSGKIAIKDLFNGQYSVSTEGGVIFVCDLKNLLSKLDNYIEKSNDYDLKLQKWIKDEIDKHENNRHN